MSREVKALLTSLGAIAFGILLQCGEGAEDPKPGKQVASENEPERPRVIPVEKRKKWQIDVTNDTDAQRRAQQALEGHVEMQFPNSTRREICQFLQKIHGVPFRLDEESLLTVECPLDEKVQAFVKSGKLRDALLLVFPAEVDWMAADDGVLISTREKIHETLETRYYDLSLLTGLDPKKILAEASEAVKDTRIDAGKFSIDGPLLVVEQNQTSQSGVRTYLYRKLKPLLTQPPAELRIRE